MDKLNSLFHPELPKRNSEFMPLPLGFGMPKDTSTPLSLQEDTVCMTSAPLSTIESKKKIRVRIKKPDKGSATAESLVQDKETTCNDKLPTCNPNIQPTESLQTSVPESISTEGALRPYWNSLVKDLSKKLWLPIEIDSVALPSNSSTGCFTSMERNSWFSMKQWNHQSPQSLPQISLLSSMSSIVESMGVESTSKKTKTKKPKKKTLKTASSKKPAINTCKVIKLKHLSPEDAHTFRCWFGTYRKTYNLALNSLKKNFEHTPLDFFWLRDRFVSKRNIPKELSYLLQTPKHVREGALKELVTAYKINLEKVKSGSQASFDINYKSKKQKDSTILIPGGSVKNIIDSGKDKSFSMYPTFLVNRFKYFAKRNPSLEFDRDCRLRMSSLGDFYLHVPMSVKASDNQGGINDAISLDPGVRDFLLGYSPTKRTCYKFGSGDISRIQRLCHHLDKLISKRNTLSNSKQKHSKRNKVYKIDKALYRARQRIRNLVKEVHCKVVHFLVTNFRTILIPSTTIKEMVKRKNRRINSKTARNMLTWSHYKFRQRLLTKSSLASVEVIEGGEEYTSKTCSNCGCIHSKLGGQKMFKCPNCGVKIDRDVNGSRGIFLKLIASKAPEGVS